MRNLKCKVKEITIINYIKWDLNIAILKQVNTAYKALLSPWFWVIADICR